VCVRKDNVENRNLMHNTHVVVIVVPRDTAVACETCLISHTSAQHHISLHAQLLGDLQHDFEAGSKGGYVGEIGFPHDVVVVLVSELIVTRLDCLRHLVDTACDVRVERISTKFVV